MYLKSLRMRDFAGVAEREVPLFAPGLNVVVGDNEAGKSTLLTALRAALFQKHRGTSEAVKALSPYGRIARPEISIEFETGGTAYRLSKAFIQKQSALLEWTGGRLENDAAEEKLAELFGFAHPSKGESKIEAHQGAFGLLWVEQGRAPGGIDLGAGRNAVAAALEGEVGAIIGGENGRALIDAARAMQERFYTATTLKDAKHSPLAAARTELAALREELAERQERRRLYEDRLERVSLRRASLEAYLKDDAVGRAEAALAAAQARARAVESVRAEHAEAERALLHAAALLERAEEGLARRRDLVRRSADAATAARSAEAALAEHRTAALGAGEDARAAATRRDASRQAAEAAERRLGAIEAARRLARLAGEAERLERRLTQAQAIAARIDALARDARGPSLDAKTLERIEVAGRDAREAEIRLAAASPAVELMPDDGRSARAADGARLHGTLKVTGRQEIVLDGWGRIAITPGGGAGDLKRAFDEARAELARRLSAAGVADIDAARLRERETRERASALAAARKELDAAAPEGLAALQRQGSELSAEMAGIGSPDSEDPASVEGDLDEAQADRRRAQDAMRAAEQALEAARASEAAWAARLARLEADAVHAGEAAARLEAELRAAEATAPTPTLEDALAAARGERDRRVELLALRRRTLDEADADVVTLDLKRREDALAQVRASVDELRGEVIRLESELGVQGASELGAEIARLDGEIATLAPRVDRLDRQARASRLLHATLTQAQREARENWLAPIRAEVEPFLRMLHPGTSVELDEATFDVRVLRRGGVEESFARLSQGAREQIAVVTRLALARLLKKGGYPAAVILDDALVNTDERRLERMHLVLRKAAESLQIIVLTCRERDFRDLGAPIIRL
ncbi:AAA family ATPase [Antarcticirhabdus aurantiaca]|uniref:AAA family ATPase n=1 Tax=Antarcticirhabdus aurantiaca TaxID=2606717 RepID=A0ACD4NIT7_9HYPH|nr:AAA family ATPase [Antarcticirhabdus aurantiaca]WAJ26626.1 AAA family ATPase [Jeongeuplla avenae]